MKVKSVIPYYSDMKVREQIDELFSREMLGAVIVGKFVGDFSAVAMIDVFTFLLGNAYIGQYVGYLVGIITSIFLFVYWHILEMHKKEVEEKVKPDKHTSEYIIADDGSKRFI